MLRRNLIVIAIAAFGLVFTSNAFGQWHPELDKIKLQRAAKVTKSKAPKNVVSGQSSQRTKIKKQITHDNEFENTIKRPSVAAS